MNPCEKESIRGNYEIIIVLRYAKETEVDQDIGSCPTTRFPESNYAIAKSLLAFTIASLITLIRRRAMYLLQV